MTSKWWISRKYYMHHKGNNWILFDKSQNKTMYLKKMGNITIQRFAKIKGYANPYDLKDEPYFEQRVQKKMVNQLRGKQKLRLIYDRQKGECPHCHSKITGQTGWNIHHIIPKYLGGTDNLDNLVLLHPVCHQQIHYAKEVVTTELLRSEKGVERIELYAVKVARTVLRGKERVIALTYPT